MYLSAVAGRGGMVPAVPMDKEDMADTTEADIMMVPEAMEAIAVIIRDTDEDTRAA